jgi:hypothetical protein
MYLIGVLLALAYILYGAYEAYEETHLFGGKFEYTLEDLVLDVLGVASSWCIIIYIIFEYLSEKGKIDKYKILFTTKKKNEILSDSERKFREDRIQQGKDAKSSL